MDLRSKQAIELIDFDVGSEGKNAFRSWKLEVWVRDLNWKDISTSKTPENYILQLQKKGQTSDLDSMQLGPLAAVVVVSVTHVLEHQ